MGRGVGARGPGSNNPEAAPAAGVQPQQPALLLPINNCRQQQAAQQQSRPLWSQAEAPATAALLYQPHPC